MFQMIITLLAIALTSAALMIGIKYVPAEHVASNDIRARVGQDFDRIERAYDVLVLEGGGSVPAVVGSQGDGGFEFYFRPKLKFMPSSMGDYVWSYGVAPMQVGSVYSGLGYVCMTGGTGSLSMAWKMALEKVQKDYPVGQVVYGAVCGATTTVEGWGNGKPVVTLFLVPTPTAVE